jgi:membrane protein implicated in regulation of membrane protease activity
MIWWLWVLFGIALLFLEMLTQGSLFFLFFGFSAFLVGGLTAFGIIAPWLQWALFSFFSIVDLILLRGPLKARLNLRGSNRPVDSLVGEEAVVLQDLSPGAVGKVELRGSSWSAKCKAPLAKGQRCKVEAVEGLTLWIASE